MNIISFKDLSPKLSKIKKSGVYIAGCIHFRTHGEHIYLECWDGNDLLAVPICEGSIDSIAVDLQRLDKIVKANRKLTEVKISVVDDGLVFRTDKMVFRIPREMDWFEGHDKFFHDIDPHSVDYDEMPRLPASFVSDVKDVYVFASKDDARQNLCCVSMMIVDDQLRIAATDGHRLVYRINDCLEEKSVVTLRDWSTSMNTASNPVFNLSRNGIELFTYFFSSNKPIKFTVNFDKILMEQDGVLAGFDVSLNFPDLNQIIPSDDDAHVRAIISKSELEEALKSIKPYIDPKTIFGRSFAMVFNVDSIKVQAGFPDESEWKSSEPSVEIELMVDYEFYHPAMQLLEGELNHKLRIDYKYMQEGLKFNKSDDLLMKFFDWTRPVVLVDDENPSSLNIIMPMRF